MENNLLQFAFPTRGRDTERCLPKENCVENASNKGTRKTPKKRLVTVFKKESLRQRKVNWKTIGRNGFFWKFIPTKLISLNLIKLHNRIEWETWEEIDSLCFWSNWFGFGIYLDGNRWGLLLFTIVYSLLSASWLHVQVLVLIFKYYYVGLCACVFPKDTVHTFYAL